MPTNLSRVTLAILGVAVALATPRQAHAVGDSNGRIKGTITEADSGAPVPGATITASGPKLIGGPQQVQTNEDGTFFLSELPPGPYEVEIAYAGVKPMKRKVTVRQGETSPLDVQWSAELTNAEVTEVIEERHLTRPDSTQSGTVLSFDTEKKLATQRSYTDVAQQIAGIKSDGGLPVVKGANRLANHYLVDGMDISDSVTNNFATNVNFDSISSLEVLTGGMEAQYNSMGGVINVNTNSGSDELHIDTSLYVNNAAFTANNVYGAGVLANDELFAASPLGPNQSYNATFNISGPIIKQKLWYGLSFEYDYAQSSIQAGPPMNVPHVPRTEHDFHPRLKLTYAPGSKDRITWSTSADPALIFNRDQSNSELGISEYGQSQGGFFSVVQWDHFASQNLSSNVQAGFNYNTVYQAPICQFQGGSAANPGTHTGGISDKAYTCDPDQPLHKNSTDGTSWYQSTKPINDDHRYTLQLDPSISVRGEKLGDHDAKFGIQSRYVYHTFRQHTPGGSVYNDGNGGLLESGLCDPSTGIGCLNSQRTDTPDFSNHQWGFGIGFYAQDRWKVHKRVTILPGIRFDYGTTANSANQIATASWGLGPRLGFAIDLTGDQKTILTAFYGRANDTLNLLPADYGDPRQATSSTYRWDPTANGGKGDYVFKSSAGGPDGYKLDPHATTPHTDEVTVGINREIFNDSVISMTYTFKRSSNIWSSVEINQIWDPTGQRVVGYVNGQQHQVTLFTTPDAAYRNYHGIDIIAESRPTPNWDLYAGYTLSWLFGSGAGEINTISPNAFDNPRQLKFFDGYLADDARHQVKVHASYNSHGFSAGLNLTYTSGGPLTKVFYTAANNSYSNRRTVSGTLPESPNDPNAIAGFRRPDQILITLRASYDLFANTSITKQHLTVILDVFNLLNLDTPTSVETRDLPTFGLAGSSRLSPLRVQLALRYIM